MVVTRIAELPDWLTSVYLQSVEAQSRRKNQWGIILPLLTTSLWLAFASVSLAQHPLAEKQALTNPKLEPFTATPRIIRPNSAISLTKSRLLSAGNQISLNGRTLPAAWSQWQRDANQGNVHTAISDAGVMQLLGVELLNTSNAAKQPVQWFSQSTKPLILASWLQGAYRYLDVTQLATLTDWQLSANGNTLQITTPATRVKAVRQGKQPWGDRIVIDLDRPTFWQITPQPPPAKPKPQPLSLNSPAPIPQPPPKPRNQQWLLTIDAAAKPKLIQQFNSTASANSQPTPTTVKLEASNRTTIRLSVPTGSAPRVSTLANPHRLVVDLRPDAMVERDILWYPGLRWRQQFVNLGAVRFPVVWLEINPQTVGLSFKPIWSDTSLVGIAPLIETAQRYAAVAAINGGFFNRNNKYPLGAIRRDGRWLSSPILNRGAIAWNDPGQIKIGRLNLQETLVTSTGQRLPILTLNSGYIQSGIALYSPGWGSTYTPLSDNEIIAVVQNNLVTAQIPVSAANKAAIPIPRAGYLLALRGNNTAANFLSVGTLLRQQSATQPAEFASYSQIIGAGPLLVQNRQIVLDAKAEGFSDAFIREQAVRSAICTTKAGTILVTAVHNRAGGTGPSLAETAKVMQQMNCVDALNLDGGSSTSLYLGGQLLNRSPRTAARVHNGLGIFLQPRP